MVNSCGLIRKSIEITRTFREELITPVLPLILARTQICYKKLYFIIIQISHSRPECLSSFYDVAKTLRQAESFQEFISIYV
jgi:hypothetical protein